MVNKRVRNAVLGGRVKQLLSREGKGWETREKVKSSLGARSCFPTNRSTQECLWDILQILKEELPRSVGAQYATGDQWRNNARKNEGMEPKQKQYPAVDVTGDKGKV